MEPTDPTVRTMRRMALITTSLLMAIAGCNPGGPDIDGGPGSDASPATDAGPGCDTCTLWDERCTPDYSGLETCVEGPSGCTTWDLEICGMFSGCWEDDTGSGLACSMPCQQEPLSERFELGLGDLTIGDANMDGETWQLCDVAAGCTEVNGTGGMDGFVFVRDTAGADLDGETLTTGPLPYVCPSKCTLYFRHEFVATGPADRASVESSTNGTTWIPLIEYSASVMAIESIPLTDCASYLRFRYDDDTAGGDTLAGSWALDNVSVEEIGPGA